MLLLFDRCRGSVEISAPQFPKLAYVHAHCGTLGSRFTKRHLTLFQSSMQLFVFGRIIVLIIHIRPISKEPLFGTALVILHIFYYEQSYLRICWTDFHNLCTIW